MWCYNGWVCWLTGWLAGWLGLAANPFLLLLLLLPQLLFVSPFSFFTTSLPMPMKVKIRFSGPSVCTALLHTITLIPRWHFALYLTCREFSGDRSLVLCVKTIFPIVSLSLSLPPSRLCVCVCVCLPLLCCVFYDLCAPISQCDDVHTYFSFILSAFYSSSVCTYSAVSDFNWERNTQIAVAVV